MPYGIGVDLGGTNIKIVAVSEEGQMLERSTCETQTDFPGSWVETIRQRINEIENDQAESARWIGLAAPGLAALDSLSIASMPGKLRGLEGLNWTDSLQTSHRVPVLNDAHAVLEEGSLKQGPHSLTRLSAFWKKWNGNHKDNACASFRPYSAILLAHSARLTMQ